MWAQNRAVVTHSPNTAARFSPLLLFLALQFSFLSIRASFVVVSLVRLSSRCCCLLPPRPPAPAYYCDALPILVKGVPLIALVSFEKILKIFRRSFGSDLTAPRFLFLLFTEFLREASLLAFLDVEVPAT
jgi:hypothetical protein